MIPLKSMMPSQCRKRRRWPAVSSNSLVRVCHLWEFRKCFLNCTIDHKLIWTSNLLAKRVVTRVKQFKIRGQYWRAVISRSIQLVQGSTIKMKISTNSKMSIIKIKCSNLINSNGLLIPIFLISRYLLHNSDRGIDLRFRA